MYAVCFDHFQIYCVAYKPQKEGADAGLKQISKKATVEQDLQIHGGMTSNGLLVAARKQYEFSHECPSSERLKTIFEGKIHENPLSSPNNTAKLNFSAYRFSELPSCGCHFLVLQCRSMKCVHGSTSHRDTRAEFPARFRCSGRFSPASPSACSPARS